MVRRPERSLVGWGLQLLPVFAALAVAWAVFGRYLCDDDLIMLRYAERLVDGKGMTWTDGETVHGVSAILMVLLVAGLGKLGLPLLWGMALFSLTGTLAAALCVLRAARRAGSSRRFASLLAAALVLFAPFSVWVMTGIGGAVFAAMIGWAALLATEQYSAEDHRRLRRARIAVLVLLCLVQTVRPDGLLPALCVLVLVGLNPVLRGSWRRFAAGSALPILGFAAVFAAVQQWYFGTPVPHLAGVKISLDLDLTRVGGLYVLEFVRGFFPLLFLLPVFFAPLVLSSTLRSRSAAGWFPLVGPLLPAVVWVLYLVWVGGDWMPGNRHFALVLVLVLVAAVRAVFSSALPGLSTRVRAGSLLLAALLSGAVSMTSPAALRAHDSVEWMRVTCGGSAMLGELFAGYDPLLGVEPAGCPPYETGFRTLDMLGLNDVHVSRATATGRPVSWDEWSAVRNLDTTDAKLGQVFIAGHGNGDGAYVWSREPDLVVTCDPLRPGGVGCFRSWFEMYERFDVASRYRPLVLELEDGTLWHAWVRHDAGPLGVQVSEEGSGAGSVDVPAWLLTGDRTPLRVRRDGSSVSGVVTLLSGEGVETPPVPLTEGTWSLFDTRASLAFVPVSPCARVEGAPGDLRVVVGEPGCVAVFELTPSSDVELEGLSFRRVAS